MHVVHAESVRALGGQTLRLVEEALWIERHTPHRVTLVGRGGSPFEAWAAPRVPFVPFRFRAPALRPANLRGAVALLRSLAPDVVHTHSSLDAWVFGLAARALGIPIVRGRHIAKPLPRSPLGRLPYTLLADAFTVSAPAIGRDLERGGVAPGRLFLTPGGLDLERFAPGRADARALRAELGLAPATRLVGSACNLRAMKGVDLLVRAFDAFLARTGADAALVVAGGGDPAPLRALATYAPERILFPGFRHDVERVIGALDLFVLASRSREAMSQSVAQAMAMGVEVLTSDAGGLPDLVRPGATGTLVPAGDAAALSRAIEACLARPRAAVEAQLARARAHVSEHFAQARTMERTLEAYALARSARRRRARPVSAAAARDPLAG